MTDKISGFNVFHRKDWQVRYTMNNSFIKLNIFNIDDEIVYY